MAEYIEREALMVALCKEIVGDGDYYNGKDDMQDEIRDMVSQFPSADVAPVRHARWVDNHCTACGMMPMGDEMWKHCDFEPPRFEWFMDYCPSCGCRMDG